MRPPAVGFAGEKNRLCTMSPSPDWLPPPGTASFWSMTEMIVREIRFNSGVSENGMTGWTLSK